MLLLALAAALFLPPAPARAAPDAVAQGTKLALRGERAEAVKVFKALAEREPDDREAQLFYIQAMVNALRTAEVRQEYEDRLLSRPKDPASYLFYALTIYDAHSAKHWLSRGLALDPNDPDLRAYSLALDASDAIMTGRYQDVLRETASPPPGPFRESIELIRAGALTHFGQIREAKAALENAAALLPIDPAVYLELSSAYGRNGEYRRALASAEMADHLQDSAAMRLAKVSLMGMLGGLRNAKESYESVLQPAPLSGQDYNARGSAFLALGRYQESWEDYSHAERLYGDLADKIQVIIAESVLFGADHARKDMDALLAAHPGDPDVLGASGALRAGNCQCGDVATATAAIHELDAALSADPQAVDALIWKAYAESRIDQSTSAVADLQTAVRRAPLYWATYVSLGDAYLKAKNDREAGRSYRRAVRLYPQAAQAHLGLGILALRRGRAGKAEKEFAEALKDSFGSARKGMEAAVATAKAEHGAAAARAYPGESDTSQQLWSDLSRSAGPNTQDFLLAVTSSPSTDAYQVLTRLKVDPRDLHRSLGTFTVRGSSDAVTLMEIISKVYVGAKASGVKKVTTAYLLSEAVESARGPLRGLLDRDGLEPAKVRLAVARFYAGRRSRER